MLGVLTAKSRFIESVILGLPIPQIVLAEVERGRFVILDGKQRLLSLMQFVGRASGQNNLFRLTGLDVRHDLNKFDYNGLNSIRHLRDLNAFMSHTIRATIIRNWPSWLFLHIVFERLNSGNLKLSPQELRQAIAPGPFTEYMDEATISSNPLQSLLGRTSPDPRMRDVELLVRHIAFRSRVGSYRGRMREFLDETCVEFNSRWREVEGELKEEVKNLYEAVYFLIEVFGQSGIARKEDLRIFNRSIFDAVSYYAAQPDILLKMRERPSDVVLAYNAAIKKPRFPDRRGSDTADLTRTID